MARKRFNLKRLRQQKVPFTGPILLIAARRDSGYRLVQIHIQLAPLTEAIWVLCFSCGIFIFKTLLLEIKMSMKVLKRVESSLLLQSRPGKSKNLWIYIYIHTQAHTHTYISQVFNIIFNIVCSGATHLSLQYEKYTLSWCTETLKSRNSYLVSVRFPSEQNKKGCF